MIAAAGAWRLSLGERSGWDLEPREQAEEADQNAGLTQPAARA